MCFGEGLLFTILFGFGIVSNYVLESGSINDEEEDDEDNEVEVEVKDKDIEVIGYWIVLTKGTALLPLILAITSTF